MAQKGGGKARVNTPNHVTKASCKSSRRFRSTRPRFRRYGGFDIPKLNALLEAGENETEFEKRYEIYKQVQKLMYEDVIWMRTFDDNNYQVHTSKLKGYSPWYLLRLWNTWLE